MSWPLSIFGDEAFSSFAEQAAFVQRLELDAWDARNANGRNVVDFNTDDLDEIRASGLRVNCIASPVNKVPLDWNLHGAEIEKLERAARVAVALECPAIRIFSPETEDGDGVVRWLRPMVDLAQRHGVTLWHENDWVFYGYRPEQSQRLLAEFGGPHFRAVFDFANTVLHGFRPLDDWFPWILPHLAALHIKDARAGEIVVAGAGDGQMREVFALLRAEGWSGPLSLEPHLQAAGPMSGFSGPDLSRAAVTALRALLAEGPASGEPKE